MDALSLLEAVRDTYSKLKTLSVEFLITSESEQDGSFNRHEQRARAWFAAPDRIRIEQGARHNNVTVTNGAILQQYFAAAKRYSKINITRQEMLPGFFRPDTPSIGPTFLFQRIAERIAEAKILRDETLAADGLEELCHVLSVQYDPPQYTGAIRANSALTFWVNSRTHLISRLAGEYTHRHPAHDETSSTKWILIFTRAMVNERVAPETFEFVPPADALDTSDPMGGGGGGRVAFGGGGGSIRQRGGNRFEEWHSHQWAGDTLVEHTKLKVWGLDLAIERRLTLSEDRSELRIVERITGPKGQTEREFSVPMA